MTAYTDAVATDSPVEFWKLDEASGTSAASAGSGAHAATAFGSPAIITGKDGNARTFDGVDDYLTAASVADFTAQTNYSVEAWFKVSSTDTTGVDWRTITRRDSSGAWLIRVAGSTSGIQQGAVQVYLNGKLISTGSTRFDDNAWHHVVITKATSTTVLYVDGTVYNTTSGTMGGAIGTTGNFIIGNAGGAGGSEWMKGSLDSIAIYHSALNNTRVQAHWNASIVTNVTLDVSTLTASLAAVDPSSIDTSVNIETSVGTLTGNTLQAQDVTVEYNAELFNLSPTRIRKIASGASADATNANSGGIEFGLVGVANPQFMLYDFEPTPTAGWVASDADLSIYSKDASPGSTITVKAITAEWTSGTTSPSLSTASVTGTTVANGMVTLDVTSLITNPFYGLYVTVAGTGFETQGISTINGTNIAVNRSPKLAMVYEEAAPVDIDIPLSTLTMSLAANDATPEITNPVNVEVTLTTVTMELGATEADQYEIRTAVLVPTVDGYRAQGGESFTNSGTTLTVAYNPSTNLSTTLIPTGTTAEKDTINAALERFDYPLNSLATAINARYGHPYVNVSFGDLPDGRDIGFILGEFINGTGEIIIDSALVGLPSLVRGVLLHEIAHLLDEVLLTNAQRVSIWNAMHTDPADMLPYGTAVTPGVAIDHGHYWSGGPDYLDLVEEAFANAFVKAYSDAAVVDEFSHPATLDAADKIRYALTPTYPDLLGPFPSRTPAARLTFGPLPAAAVTGTLISASLRLNVTFNSGGQYTINTIYPEGRLSDESTKVTTSLSAGTNNIDLGTIFDPKAFSIVHIGNVKTTSSQSLIMSSVEDTTTGTDPQLTLRYIPSSGATLVDVDTVTASASAPDVTVETVISPDSISDLVTVSVTVQANEATPVIGATVDADSTSTVMFGAYDPEVEAQVSVLAVVDSPRIIVTRVQVTDVNGEPVLPSEEDDPYFVSTMRTLEGGLQREFGAGNIGVPKGLAEWFRMDTSTNGVFQDRATNPDDPNFPQRGTLQVSSGVTVGLHNGPEGRHNVHFNGDAWARVTSQTATDLPVSANIEVTIRTERSTQFLMGGLGRNLIGSAQSFNIIELWMVDGYLEAREYTYGTGVLALDKTMRGHKRLDDGAWHHIVWQSAAQNVIGSNLIDFGFESEIYVDGNLDIRRRISPNPLQRLLYFGGRQEDYYIWNGTYPVNPVPQGQNFLGDMTELIIRESRTINEDQIHDQRDTMFGIIPIKPETPRIAVEAHEASSKGNKPRHLVLDFGLYGGSTTLDIDNQVFNVYDDMRYDITEINMEERNRRLVSMSFAGWGPTDDGITLRTTYNVRFKLGSANDQWTDEVTDNFRLIDLEKDVNMDDFDIISIIRFPGDANAWQLYERVDAQNQEPKVPMRKQVEDLLAQVKDQVIHHSKGLFINDPMSAIALGIVDRVDYVPSFEETLTIDQRLGANVGEIDWHAYVTDPFNGSQPWVTVPEQSGVGGKNAYNSANQTKASRYMDLHSNIKQRVRNTIQGLTTIPGWVLADYILWQDVNPMATPPEEHSMSFEDKRAGLRVGDEFYMISDYDSDIPAGFAATPMSHIKVGKAVTTFAPIFYITPSAERYAEDPKTVTGSDGRERMDADVAYGNPYLDHAVSIAAEPGDAWDGQAITGKVYVNFTETFTMWADLWATFHIMVKNGDELPDGGTLISGGLGIGQSIPVQGGGVWYINAQHMKYNYSTHYGQFIGSEVHLPGGTKPDWGWSAGGSRSGGASAGGAYAMNHFWDSLMPMKDIDVPTMAQRAARWLMLDVASTGNSTNSVDTPNVAATANDVVVEVSTNVVVDLTTAHLEFEAYTDADTISPDITVAVPTVSLTLQAHGVAQVVALETAIVLLTTEEPELQEFEVDWDNVISLTMPNNLITLILEDA